MSLRVTAMELSGVFLLEPKSFADDRGYFFESFNARSFSAETGLAVNFVQDNHSFSKAGVLRGLHYQMPRAQAKLVRAATGRVLDVVVDMRASSLTLGKYLAIELSQENRCQLFVPEGFAHGFQVLSPEGADFLYKTTDYWVPTHEHCIRFDDPDLRIQWSSTMAPVVSAKDASGIAFRDALKFP